MNLPVSQVLLVEDDPRMPEVLSHLLQEDHIALTSAQDAAQGLKLARQQRFDAILLDLGLPDLNGFELLRQFKECPETQAIPVVVLTAWNSTSDKLRGFELGAVDYLTKPFDASELRARLRSVLRSKQLQDELAQTNRELVSARFAAETLARTKADFLADMSHEIRTLMNGVIGMAGLVLETPLTREQRGYVETIYSSSDSLLTIINDILDFSKIESGKLEIENQPFELRACIEDILDLLAPKAAEKKLDLSYQIEEGIAPMLCGDVNRIRQVLANLLGNGIKFTSTGEVVVLVKALSGPGDGASSDEPWHLHFQVRDTGIGIPVDRLARLFKPFSQADASTARKYGGTGLGLTISKRLVEMMGGKMWVESVPEKGSTFQFTLPLPGVPDAPAVVPEPPHPQLTGLRLLIVDDNLTNCRSLTLQARQWGMEPRDTQSAAKALDWLRKGETFDLAILDMQMPEMDGVELAGSIRALSGPAGKMPLVLLASIGVRTDQPEFAAAGFASHLNKPIRSAHLREALLAATSQTRPAAPAPKPEPKAVAAPAPAVGAGSLRVLVCDDNAINQKVASRLLQQIGYRPDVAANGLEALAALDRQPYDLIFMDVMMPEMNGLDATRTIRERQTQRGTYPNYKPNLVIVAMTASAMGGDREKCLAAGMDDYVAKPVRMEELRTVVQRWSELAAREDVAEVPAAATAEPAPEPATAAPPDEHAPVDMTRLLDFTDGDPENLRELIQLYLTQTGQQFEQLHAAVQAADAEEVRRLAHSCAGASATCGVRKLVPLLREMERQGFERQLTTIAELSQQAEEEFGRVRAFLEAYLAAHLDLAAQPRA